jgi:UDP-GlcNAc3NAcA epimerase
MKIATIIGARPQFIKAAMVSMEIANRDIIEEILIHTGQHYDNNMSEIFFNEMGIPKPRHNLGIGSLSHGAMIGRQLEEIEKILIQIKPDLVLVYGDTNSTLAGALAASNLHIPVAHVEAGLRSFNRKMPEEINRVLTDHIAELLFVPTDTAEANLIKEGIDKIKINKVGDVMYDAVLHFADIAEKKSNILQNLDLESKKYILATVHRPENTDSIEKLGNIFSALAEAPLPVVIPIHPRTKKKLVEYNIVLKGQIISIESVGYLDMMMLEKNAHKIATDSGGIQKEAYFYGVPCITMRNETEWIELVEVGANVITGANHQLIMDAIYKKNDNFIKSDIYGTGNASFKILEELVSK